jgi:hypothetical protein
LLLRLKYYFRIDEFFGEVSFVVEILVCLEKVKWSNGEEDADNFGDRG